jgi:hypothetical protein
MVKILGALDLFVALILLFVVLGDKIPLGAAIIAFAILIAKSSVGIVDIGWLTDFIAFLLILLSVFLHVPVFFVLIIIVLIVIKGFLSVFA